MDHRHKFNYGRRTPVELLMPETITYSVIIPVYNSGGGLNELVTRINSTLQGKLFEIIIIDDGSTDNSWEELSVIKKNNNHLTIIQLSKNFGQHSALFCGFNFCKGEFIITLDDDLQHPPEEINKLIAEQEKKNCDVVYGIYKIKQHSFMRNSGSYLVRKSSKLAAGYSGLGSSFRLIKNEIIQKIVTGHKQNFFYLDEVFYWYTSSFGYAEVEHHIRKHGKSGYNFIKLSNLYLNIVVNYSAVPLKLMTRLGLIFSVISFSLGVRFVYRKLVHHVPLGYTSLIVTILFSASVIMFCLGIIGQYLYKIYQSQLD